MSEEIVELARRAFRAFNDRDLDAVLATLHDDVEAFPDFHVEILEVRDLGEFMVLALRLRGRGGESDTPVDTAVWHVNQFRDGKTIRWRVYTSEGEALEAVGVRE